MAEQRATPEVAILPSGRHGLGREYVASSQRDRLLRSMIGQAAAVGYARVTVDEVIRGARTSKRTFYGMFPDKEACFLAAYDMVTSDALGSVAAVLVPDEDPRVRIDHGVAALLGALAGDPDAARVAMIEVLAAGPAATPHRVHVHQSFADALVVWHEESRRHWPGLEPLSATAALAVIGAINEPITMTLLRHGADRLPSMAKELSDIVARLMFTDQR